MMDCCAGAGTAGAFDGARASVVAFDSHAVGVHNVQFATVEYDTGTYFNIAADNTKLTIPSDGKYLIGYTNEWIGTGNPVAGVALYAWLSYVGSTRILLDSRLLMPLGAERDQYQSAVMEFPFLAGDTVQLQVQYFGTVLAGTNCNSSLWIERRGS